MANPINRRLKYQDEQQQWLFIEQHDITGIAEPVVILGDPGMGKTTLTKWLGTLPGMKYCGAGRFKRTDKPKTLIADDERIIVDGLDEIASSAPSGAVDAVLAQLSRMDNPPFIMSCREADWQGAADRRQIEDDYGVAPVLLHLEPFSRDDALTFLANEFPEINGSVLLQRLAKRGVESLYENPLTLRLPDHRG